MTTIDGSACTTGVSVCSVITFIDEGPDSVLDGFTITGGSGHDPPPAGSGSTFGGGLYCINASPTILNCRISGNTALNGTDGYGGGMINCHSSPTLTNCTISGNAAGRGGAVLNVFSSSPTLTNCTISGNTASFVGGGMYNVFSSSPTMTNCTISGNVASTGGGGVDNVEYSFPTLTNSILWGDSPNEIESDSFGETTVTFSDIQGGYSGSGNIDFDPQFVDAANGDYHLQPGSPCIDSGTNDAPRGLPATDIDGDPRVLCDVVDMGVDESTDCSNFLRGDVDGNGSFTPVVDAIFLLTYGFLMGPEPPCLDAADVDDDGVTDALVDAIHLLEFGFTMGPPPPPPHPLCGSDPTPDDVGCDDYTGCP